jgi:hypothetical protein
MMPGNAKAIACPPVELDHSPRPTCLSKSCCAASIAPIVKQQLQNQQLHPKLVRLPGNSEQIEASLSHAERTSASTV